MDYLHAHKLGNYMEDLLFLCSCNDSVCLANC